MKELVAVAEKIAAKLIERRQTIAVAESSTGGLISAALLAVPGASAYFLGSAVVYTRDARRILMDIPDEAMKGDPFGLGSLRQIAGRPDPPAFCLGLGPVRDRRHRADRQPLRRRRRP
jgi:hypothetical protein